MVRAGQLDQAEAVLKEKIWDLLPNAMAPLWSALEQLGPLALVERPALLSARLRLSPSPHRAPVSTRAARSTRRTSWGCEPRAIGALHAPGAGGALHAPGPAHGPPLPPGVGRVADGMDLWSPAQKVVRGGHSEERAVCCAHAGGEPPARGSLM